MEGRAVGHGDRVLSFYRHSTKAGLGHTSTCLASKKGQRAVHGGANRRGARHDSAGRRCRCWRRRGEAIALLGEQGREAVER